VADEERGRVGAVVVDVADRVDDDAAADEEADAERTGVPERALFEPEVALESARGGGYGDVGECWLLLFVGVRGERGGTTIEMRRAPVPVVVDEDEEEEIDAEEEAEAEDDDDEAAPVGSLSKEEVMTEVRSSDEAWRWSDEKNCVTAGSLDEETDDDDEREAEDSEMARKSSLREDLWSAALVLCGCE